MLATHCNLVPLVPDGIGVKSYYYYSVQFVRKKSSSSFVSQNFKTLHSKELKYVYSQLAKANHSCTVNRTAGDLYSQRWTTESSISMFCFSV